jgi:hypothetical protein
MILEHEEVNARLANPNNLLNRLRSLTKPQDSSIVSIPSHANHLEPSSNPILPPTIDELVDDVEDKVNTARCYSGAKEVLASAIDSLKVRIVEVDNPSQLSKIAKDMGKIVNGFDENKPKDVSRSIPIIYRPVQLTENNYQIVMVSE